MTKKTLDSARFIDLDTLKSRFSFIKNEVLRDNIAIKMKYIIFLTSIEEEYDLPGPINYITFKTIIIYTASIVEALINYKLHELLEEKRIDEGIFSFEEKYSLVKKPINLSNNESIFGVLITKKNKKLSNSESFQSLNRASKKCSMFDKELFDKSEKIRKVRNKIHTYSLKELDDKYTKKDIEKIFDYTASIIERIKIF